jgi:hypothetical protein
LFRFVPGPAIGDQTFDGSDQGKGLELGRGAASGLFEVPVGDFPKACQDAVTGLFEPALFVDVLTDKVLFDRSTMLLHVGPDARFGLCVGGGVRVETGVFGCLTVSHGSGHDQTGEGCFLVCDWIGYLFPWHGCFPLWRLRGSMTCWGKAAPAGFFVCLIDAPAGVFMTWLRKLFFAERGR